MKFALIAFALAGFSVQARASLPDPSICGNNSYSIEFKVARSVGGGIRRDKVETIITDINGKTVGIFAQSVGVNALESNLIKGMTLNEIKGGNSKLSIKASNSEIDQVLITGIGPNVEELYCNLLN